MRDCGIRAGLTRLHRSTSLGPQQNWSRYVIVPGTVIILNGPSSAGKTSIQNEIQDTFDQPYLAMGIDSLLAGMMPARYFSREVPDKNEVLATDSSKDPSGAPLFTLRFGPKGRQFVSRDAPRHSCLRLSRE